MAGIAFGLALAILAAYHLFKLPPALPVMFDLYGYDRVLAGGFMSVFAVAGLTLSLRVGHGLARHGAGRYIAGACVLFVIGDGLALAWPESGAVVLLARGLEGIAFTVCAILGPLIANLNAPARHLALVIGLTATWIPTGQIIASLLALPLVESGDWQPLWWLGIGLTLGLAGWAWWLAERRPEVLTAHGVGAARASAMTAAERRTLIIGGAVFGLWSGQYFGYMTWLPQYLVEIHGLAKELAALAYIVPVAILLVVNLITGALLRAGAPLTPLFAGSILVQTVTWLATPMVGAGALGLAALIVYGIAAGVTPVCLFAMPSAVMGARLDVRAFAIVFTGRNLGVLAGPVLLAQAVTLAGDWSWVWPIFGGATFVSALGALVVGRRIGAHGA